MKTICKYLQYILYGVMVAILFGACAHEEIGCGDIEEKTYVNLVFDTRSSSMPSVSDNPENGVASLRVFIYNEAAELEFTQKYMVAEDGSFGNPVIEVTAGVKDIYVVVNEEAVGVDKDDLIRKLVALSTLGAHNQNELEALHVQYLNDRFTYPNIYPQKSEKGLLMAGWTKGKNVSGGSSLGNPQEIVVDVVRNWVRLDLKMQKAPSLAGASVYLQQVLICNECIPQTLFENKSATGNPADAVYYNRVMQYSYNVNSGKQITNSQTADSKDNLQDIDTYYLLPNLGNYSEGNLDNATYLRFIYTVDGESKTSDIYLNANNATKPYNVVRNTKYELAVTIDGKQSPSWQLHIKDWKDIEVTGDIFGSYISAPGKIMMDWWELGQKFDTTFTYTADGTVMFAGLVKPSGEVVSSLDWLNVVFNQQTASSGTVKLTYTPTSGDHSYAWLRLRTGNIFKDILVIYDNGYLPYELLRSSRSTPWMQNTPAKGIHLSKKNDLLWQWSKEFISSIPEINSDNNGAKLHGNGEYNTSVIISKLGSDAPAAYHCLEKGTDFYLPSLNEMKTIYELQSYLGTSYKFSDVANHWTSTMVGELPHVYSVYFGSDIRVDRSNMTTNAHVRCIRNVD